MPGAFARLGPRLAADFLADTGQRVELAAFRPSGLLAHAILAGETADVYVSASVLWMRRLQRAGIVRHWSTLARNRLCLIARHGVQINGLADVARPGLVVVAPQAHTDPCGRYVEELWRQSGLLNTMRAKQANGELLRSEGSGDLPLYLEDGRAAVGMLYASEARQLDVTAVKTIELSADEDMRSRIRFVIAAITPRGQPFVHWLLGTPGQKRLAASGFLT